MNRAVHVEEKGQPDCKRIDEREKLTSHVHELVIDDLGGLGDVVGQGLANAGGAGKSGYEFENDKTMKISIVSHELTHCILFPDTVFEDSKHLVSGYRVGENAVRIESLAQLLQSVIDVKLIASHHKRRKIREHLLLARRIAKRVCSCCQNGDSVDDCVEVSLQNYSTVEVEE